MSGITQAERQKYAEIFQARGQVGGYMTGKRPLLSIYSIYKSLLKIFY